MNYLKELKTILEDNLSTIIIYGGSVALLCIIGFIAKLLLNLFDSDTKSDIKLVFCTVIITLIVRHFWAERRDIRNSIRNKTTKK